ncbi:MAG: nitroreductase family protein [Coriobacteriales bacterium]|nr:nitroreductase family protein [Coriobacteriales bacterium]
MAPQDFAALVKASRTFRRFDQSTSISRETLLELVDVARFAPCGNNLQLLRYHVVSDPEQARLCCAHHKWAGLLRDWDGPDEGERPCAYIAICAPAGARKNAIRNQDAGIAAQTIMLAARAAGLGGCMVGSFDKELDGLLGLVDKNLETLVLLAVGVPTEQVVLEEADEVHGVAYWHDEAQVNHVPKLPLSELLV